MVGTCREAQVTEYPCFKDWLSHTEVHHTKETNFWGDKETTTKKIKHKKIVFNYHC